MGKLDKDDSFRRVMNVIKVIIFAEGLLFVVGANGMTQAVDQLSVQQTAYGLSWGETESFTAPGYLGIYPNNLGMAVILYLLSFVIGHYNNLFIMIVFAALVPLIYSDLAAIGGKFGLSRKSQVLILICGMIFLPLQTKALIIYGDIPGLFLSVRAMKCAVDIASEKRSFKSTIVVILFPAFASLFKNNFIIFAIAITVYLFAELLRNRRFRELYIPLAVIALPIILNYSITIIVGWIIGRHVSSGASKLSWIAMGMQEDAGMYNGYNTASFAEAGYNTDVHSAMAKDNIAQSLSRFASDPEYAINFYTRKVLIQWSDPTHCAFESHSRNIYTYDNASPLIWLLASPRVISLASSLLKVFQVLILLGNTVYSIETGRKRNGSPAILLYTTFVGGYLFHLIWEAAPFYTMSYIVIIIPTGVAGLIALTKKLSRVRLKKPANSRININSGIIYFVTGICVFLFAFAGLGTLRTRLIEGRNEYKKYYDEVLDNSRDPIDPGVYYLKPSSKNYEGNGIKVNLIKYAGKYRMRLITDNSDENAYLTSSDGQVKVDWFSGDKTQTFTILKNKDGSCVLCQGTNRALSWDTDNKRIVFSAFTGYSFNFYDDSYDQYISENPNVTWKFTSVY